jgi:hypothetical protein
MSTLLEITGSGVGIISLRNIRIENPHFFPHGAALADELLMPRRRLIGIVRGVVLKDDDQGDFKIAIVHLAAVVGTRAGGKENLARVSGQMLLARRDHFLLILGRGLMQREINYVGEHCGTL